MWVYITYYLHGFPGDLHPSQIRCQESVHNNYWPVSIKVAPKRNGQTRAPTPNIEIPLKALQCKMCFSTNLIRNRLLPFVGIRRIIIPAQVPVTTLAGNQRWLPTRLYMRFALPIVAKRLEALGRGFLDFATILGVDFPILFFSTTQLF